MAKWLTAARAAMLAGCLLVAAPPAWLLWTVVRPARWDSRTLRVRFESVRYEAVGLVFTYEVENRAWRSLRLLPELTELRPLEAAGLPPAGYASFHGPILLEGHRTQRVELRIELPADPPPRALVQPVPGISEEPGPGALLPLRGPTATAQPAPEPAAAAGLDRLIEDALRNLDGFELVNPAKGVRLRFPRGW